MLGEPNLRTCGCFESVDPVLLATKKEHYPALVQSLLGEKHDLGADAERALSLLSHEVLAAKRMHELVPVELLVTHGAATLDDIARSFTEPGLPSDNLHVRTAVDTVALRGRLLTGRQGEISGGHRRRLRRACPVDLDLRPRL